MRNDFNAGNWFNSLRLAAFASTVTPSSSFAWRHNRHEFCNSRVVSYKIFPRKPHVSFVSILNVSASGVDV
jgi:hypothetical protein